jgi:glutamate synthase domain-containing protein 2/glutamate synthase domain-containing protein 3
VTSLETTLGSQKNIFDETPEHARQLKLSSPIISNSDLDKIKQLNLPGLKSITLSILFPISKNPEILNNALEKLCEEASQAIEDGYSIIILSDRGLDKERVPIPSLLALAGVHHHLIRAGTRTKVGLIVESGEPKEVAHFALLIGYGAGAVNPYLALDVIEELTLSEYLDKSKGSSAAYKQNYLKAIEKGLLKIISKMGISTIQSYLGAQVFEAIGLSQSLVDRYFTWTPSRIGGIDLTTIEKTILERHSESYRLIETGLDPKLNQSGAYYWRRDGEYHMWNPDTISKLQYASRTNDYKTYKEFAHLSDENEERSSTLRGLLAFKPALTPIALEEVESTEEIIKRLATGAISLGAISKEAHETLAIAMNRIGAKSNSGEGGEDFRRYSPDSNGEFRHSAIKQVASGRFGVTTNYLVNASDLQIKMAQGSKPGEGGQLPGHKVDEYIGWVRNSTPGVELISPPPHHDIYSIEDLAQLIHDLKNVNPEARVHVKLVSEVGVGTIAAGVSKAHADVVLISGDSGGTGASPESSVKHAGLPWELGVAETHQVLVHNNLRGRIVLQTDGQLKTGRDVAIACLLGAEEFGIATASLVTLGCIMLRKCHLNSCSVGIATQDPELRKRFAGKPEFVINYFNFIAKELREIMAYLGFRTVNEMVGRVDRLEPKQALEYWKTRGLDLTGLLYHAEESQQVPTYCCESQDHNLEGALDHQLIDKSQRAIDYKEKVQFSMPIRNANRTVGAMLSGTIAKKFGEDGLPNDTININFFGSAGQSFGAFLANGISFALHGDANDYLGKGASGGRLVVLPPDNANFVAEKSTIIGNVALYGATGGKAFIRGLAGERFCVRNSGAVAVVEGVGDHGCEYMTNGKVIVLGPTGRNFAAGMSGGIAYVFDEKREFKEKCNPDMVDLESVDSLLEQNELYGIIMEHFQFTGSQNGKRIIEDWEEMKKKFVKVYPRDYKRVIEANSEKKSNEVTSG